MKVTRLTDPVEFLAKTETFLLRQEAAHGLILGIVGGLEKRPLKNEPLMVTVSEKESLELILLCTPPRPILLAGHEVTEEALGFLTDYLVSENIQPAGVTAAEPLGMRFADLWTRRTGCRCRLAMSQRIYQLTKVHPTPRVPGQARLADLRDQDLVADWYRAFGEEAVPDDMRHTRQAVIDLVAPRLANGQVLLWDDPTAGGPVSMAMAQRPTRNGIAVGGVYTPPERRRRGYATGCVSALSALSLERGHGFCVLYTDLSNPTSNSIYQKIGYRAVTDSAMRVFEYGEECY